MAEKPPLVLAVEQALDAPARWVRYDPRLAAPAVDDTPPLVAAIEEALGTQVETLRYLPSLATVAPAAPAPVPIRALIAPPDRATSDDDALVAAVEAALADAVIWLQYAPAVGEMRLISPRVA